MAQALRGNWVPGVAMVRARCPSSARVARCCVWDI